MKLGLCELVIGNILDGEIIDVGEGAVGDDVVNFIDEVVDFELIELLWFGEGG